MRRQSDDEVRAGPTANRRLLARARARAEQERDFLGSTQTSHYAAASLGQSPYVALPDCGVVVVQRKCGWGC